MKTKTVVACASGQLDVMGGVSDYSGGICLQMPLDANVVCRVTAQENSSLSVWSDEAPRNNGRNPIEIPLGDFSSLENLAREPNARWARRVLGAFAILQREFSCRFSSGLKIEIESNLPTGASVVSSAALETATLSALNQFFELGLNEHQIARLAHKIEIEFVGEPCEITDFLSVALGQANSLLRLNCQPDLIEGFEEIPSGIAFWGIDSGARHANRKEKYRRARCATMIGKRIVSQIVPEAMRGPEGALYLANLGADVWRAIRERVPAQISGAQFLKEFGAHNDTATQIEPDEIYKVRLAAEHPIYEADRVRRFVRLWRLVESSPHARDELLRACGELMVQSHFSYDHRCDLNAPETDFLVELAREVGPKSGIYGARITGKGAGGTVALLVDIQRNSLEEVVANLRDEYEARTGLSARLFRGKSNGALA